MAEIVFIPKIEKAHSCQDEVHKVEKRFFIDNPATQYLPKGSVVKCSCERFYELAEYDRRNKFAFQSGFATNDQFHWKLVKDYNDQRVQAP